MTTSNISNLVEFYDYKEKRKAIACDYKIQYQTKLEADAAVDKYRSRVLFSNMNAYFCRPHNSYHIGHGKFMEQKEIRQRDLNILFNINGSFKTA